MRERKLNERFQDRRSKSGLEHKAHLRKIIIVIGYVGLALLIFYFRHIYVLYTVPIVLPATSAHKHKTALPLQSNNGGGAVPTLKRKTPATLAKPATKQYYKPSQGGLHAINLYSEVDHLWKYDKNNKVNVFDTYWAAPYVSAPNSWYPVLMVDGWLPVEFTNNNKSYTTDLYCELGGPPPVEPRKPCADWGCTCQGVSECFFVKHSETWGDIKEGSVEHTWYLFKFAALHNLVHVNAQAPAHYIPISTTPATRTTHTNRWLDNKCKTVPSTYKCPWKKTKKIENKHATNGQVVKTPVDIMFYSRRNHQINYNYDWVDDGQFFRGPPVDRTTMQWVVCKLPDDAKREQYANANIKLTDGKG